MTVLFVSAPLIARSLDAAAGRLQVGRWNHTSTALPDGTILVVGGDTEDGVTAASEVVLAGKVVRGPETAQARADHTATLLPDGRVLVAGGRDAAWPLDSSEIYDSASRSFGVGPRLTRPRMGHTATLLADGSVLVAGGDESGTAEILTATGEFEALEHRMYAVRSKHAAIALRDGRVLLIGGVGSAGETLSVAEVFDPATRTFMPMSMRTARISPLLRELPDGKVQVIGGDDEATVELFNPSGYFTALGYPAASSDAEAVGRSLFRLAFLGARESEAERVRAHGGFVVAGRRGASATTAAGVVVVSGGRTSAGAATDAVSVFSTGAWITTDKSDYSPGEYVTITGAGFAPNEKVSLVFERTPETAPATTIETTADESGNIRNADYVCVASTDAGVTFLLTATGQTSGLTAQTTFTDSHIRISISSPSITEGNSGTSMVTFIVSASSACGSGYFLQVSTGGGSATAGSDYVSSSASLGFGTTTSRTFSVPVIGDTIVEPNETFFAFVTNQGGSFTCIPVTVQNSGTATIINDDFCTPPTVTAHPSNATGIYGGTASFTSEASGTAPVSIQWQVSTDGGGAWSNIGGATSNTLFLSSLSVSQNGYKYRAFFSNGCGAAASNPATLTVNKAPATLSLSNLDHIFDGSPKAAIVTTNPPGLSGVTVTYDGSPTAPTNAGSYAVVASLDNPNYTAPDATGTMKIGKAASTTTVTCVGGPYVYSGSPLTPCTANVTGAGGLNQALTVNYTNNTNAGTAAASAEYPGGDNHTGSSDSENFTIDKASSTTTVTCPASVVYDGSAQTPCSANATGAGGLNQALAVNYTSNTNAGTATASASYAGDDNHTGSSDSENFTIDKAPSTTTVTCPASVVYNGSAQTPCSANVTGAGGLNQALTVNYTNNTNAGTATASASYAGDDNHTGSSDSENFTIDKAPTTTTVTCPASVVYTGSAQTPCSANVTGAGGLNQALTVNYTNNTNAGTATASASYAGGDNHTGSADSKNFTIDKAPTTTSVTCPASVVYTGSAQTPCSANVTGAGGLNQALTVSYTNNTNAGTATASASYAGDDNHTGSADSKNFTIDKAPSVTTVTCPASVVYNGSPHTPCTANVTGAGGLSQSLPVAYVSNTDAGTATASATYGGDDNHSSSSDTEYFLIDKATSTTTVTCPASVVFTGSAQTPCTATVTGDGGLNQTLAVSYTNNINAGTATASATFAGDANHTGSSDSENLTIDKAPTTTTVTCPASVVYSGSAQAPCSATVTGAALSQPVAVTYLNNVNAGTATANAVFAGGDNHTGSSDSKSFTIEKAPSTTTVTCPPSVVYSGAPLTPCSASVIGAGGLNQSLAVSYANNTNAGTASASASFTGDDNHTGSSDSKSFTIEKAPSVTTVTCPSSVVYTGAALTPCTANVTGAGGLNQALTVGYTNNTNAGTATASASYAGDDNHTGSSDSETFTIEKAPSVTTVTCPASVIYNGSAQTPCSANVTGVGGLNQALTVNYTNNTNAGTATASASYAGDDNHTGSADSKNFTIDKAPSVTTVTCPASVIYSGSAQTPCSANVTGAGGLNQPLTVSYVNNVNAGNATASAAYPGDDNHTGSADSKSFTIDKAPSVTSVTCPASVIYNGSAQTPCSASVTGAGGLNQPLTVSYANNVNAGNATASASYPGDDNHTASSDSETFVIEKASSTTTVTCPASVIYNGSPQTPCTASVTGAGGLNQALTVSYANNTNAGTATASASYPGDDNHTGSSDSETFTIEKATSTTTVTCPASVVYTGSPLTPCTATVTGAGGLNQALTVNYTNNTNAGSATASAEFAGDANHTGSSDSDSFTIEKAPSTTTVTCPASVVYNGAAQTPCSAVATGAGGLNQPLTVNYTNNTNAGTATAAASYAGDANHTPSSGSTTFTIAKAPVTVTVSATSAQYSDTTTITYSVTSGSLTPQLTGTMTFFIGSRQVGGPIPLGAALAPVVVIEMPGSYTVTAVFASTNDNFQSGNGTTPVQIGPEDATVRYTGPTSAWVNSNDQAPITLTALVYDPGDGFPGDIRNARVTFVNMGTGGPMGTCKDVRVDLVDPSNTSYGTATCNWTANLQKSDNAQTFELGLRVAFGYDRFASQDNVMITVARNVQSQVMAMGASVVPAAPKSNFGEVTGAAQFAFDVTYNKSLTNLQGDGEVIFVAGGKTYRAKSNSLVSLIVKAGNPSGDGTATLTTKASIVDVTNPLSPVSVEGNATIQFDVTGAGETNDTVAITVWGRDGGVLFSNYFIPATGKTAQQKIATGNIVVR